MQRAGVWAVFLRSFEDEVRWRAPALANFATRVREHHLRLFLMPAGYGILAAELQPSSLFLQVHPDTRQIDNRGRRVQLACPNNPRYLEWFTTSMRTLAWMIEADGFVWEEPGFHFARGAWACRCRHCAELYAAHDSRGLPPELTPALVAMRQRSIATLMTAASAAIKSVDNALASLVMPTPAPQTGAVPTGNENWRMLASTEGVDGLILTWPPTGYQETSVGAASGFYTSARAWVPADQPLLLRLICPADFTETEMALQQLKQLRVPGVLLEDVGLFFAQRRLTRRAEDLLAVVNAVSGPAK
jgi:hypothetical protein